MNRTLNDVDTVGKKRALDEPNNMGSLSFIKTDRAVVLLIPSPLVPKPVPHLYQELSLKKTKLPFLH